MRKPTAAKLALLMASVATAAESTCAIDCFQGLITNGPPADCKEATNYLCFCTMPTLQDNFSKCADKSCADEKGGAMSWANELCAKLGKPIDLGAGEDAPKTDETTTVIAPTTSVDEAKQTTEAEKTTEAAQTTAADDEKTDSKAEETSSAETSAPSETSNQTSETCTTETTLTTTETKLAKPTTTGDSDDSGGAGNATSVTTDKDGDVVTLTGSAETASASADVEESAGSVMAPSLFAMGVVAALWQLL